MHKFIEVQSHISVISTVNLHLTYTVWYRSILDGILSHILPSIFLYIAIKHFLITSVLYIINAGAMHNRFGSTLRQNLIHRPTE